MNIDINALRAQREALKKKEEENKKNSGGGSNLIWYRNPNEADETLIRVILEPDKTTIGKTVSKHFDIQGEQGGVLCMKTHGMGCPICDLIADYETRLGEDIDKFRPNHKVYLNALVLQDNTPSTIREHKGPIDPTKPVIWGTNEMTLGWILDQMIEFPTLLDVDKGHNFKFARKSAGGAFIREVKLAPSPIHNDPNMVAKIKESIVNLDKIWKIPDDAFRQGILKGRDRLREQLENLLLTRGSNNPPAPDNMNPPATSGSTNSAPGGVHTPPAGTMQNSTNSSIPDVNKAATGGAPKGAPTCFADKGTYNDQSQKCLECTFEFDCQSAIKKAGA